MKKILLLAALTIVGLSTANAQDKKAPAKKATTSKSATASKKAAPAKVVTPQVEGPGIVFESETIDYGTIQHNADGKREFVFVNNGNKPLIITNATGSCGCTVPTKPTEPIMPGQKGVIGVKYATDRVGAFDKKVTVTSNASETPKQLTIKGTVLPDEAPKG